MTRCTHQCTIHWKLWLLPSIIIGVGICDNSWFLGFDEYLSSPTTLVSCLCFCFRFMSLCICMLLLVFILVLLFFLLFLRLFWFCFFICSSFASTSSSLLRFFLFFLGLLVPFFDFILLILFLKFLLVLYHPLLLLFFFMFIIRVPEMLQEWRWQSQSSGKDCEQMELPHHQAQVVQIPSLWQAIGRQTKGKPHPLHLVCTFFNFAHSVFVERGDVVFGVCCSTTFF